jgi:hypothetical protein
VTVGGSIVHHIGDTENAHVAIAGVVPAVADRPTPDRSLLAPLAPVTL